MTAWIEMLRKAEVKRRTALSNTLLHELLKLNQFPAPAYLTEGKRLPVWSAAEVDAWNRERLAKRAQESAGVGNA